MATFKNGGYVGKNGIYKLKPSAAASVTADGEQGEKPQEDAAPVFESFAGLNPSVPAGAAPENAPSADSAAAEAAAPAAETAAEDLPAENAAVPVSFDADVEEPETAIAPPVPVREFLQTSRRGSKRKKLVKPWGYVGLLLLFCLPVLGLIFAIIFACAGDNRNRKNFARGWLLALLVCALLTGGACAALYYTKLAPAAGESLSGKTAAWLSGNTAYTELSDAQTLAVLRGEYSSLSLEQLSALTKVQLADPGAYASYIDPTAAAVQALPAALPAAPAGAAITAANDAVCKAAGVQGLYTLTGVTQEAYDAYLAAFQLTGTKAGDATVYVLNNNAGTVFVRFDAASGTMTIRIF